jgi:DNA-binding MarR family transcriptional regulator
MDVQEQMVNEGLAALQELVHVVLAFRSRHYTHERHLHPAEQAPDQMCPDEGPGGLGPSRGMEWRRPEGIPEAQIKLVVHLALHGPQTMSDVAEGLGVTTPAVTGLVDKLEKHGMVERLRDSQDRRVVRVRLAPRAQMMAEQRLARSRRQIRSVLATLSPEEQSTFVRTLRLLAQTMYPRQGGESESE